MTAMVLTHLGLGDHIVCNGMMQELAKRHNSVVTFAKEHNVLSVTQMFLDAPIEVRDVREINEEVFPVMYMIGYNWRDKTLPFDKDFYRIANVPFAERWNSFKAILPSDQFWNPPSGPYVFLHEDPQRDMLVDRKRLPLGMSVFEVKKGETPDIFEYYTMMAMAAEIHVIDSAFMFLADSFSELGAKTVVHRYARRLPPDEIPTLMRIERILT